MEIMSAGSPAGPPGQGSRKVRGTRRPRRTALALAGALTLSGAALCHDLLPRGGQGSRAPGP
ncbi:hypothetical protein, partial [Streptomyces sp. SID685]